MQRSSPSMLLMNIETYVRWLEAQRALHQQRGDRDGVHLCDLALVQQAAAYGPETLMEVASPVLEGMVARRSLFGIDVLGYELLCAGLTLGAQGFVTEVATLVGRSGREAVAVRVVDGLLRRAEDVEGAQVRETLRAALSVTVAGGDFGSGAAVLEALAAHHLDLGQTSVGVLCLTQGALYARQAGLEVRAQAMLSRATALSTEDGQASVAVAEACLRGGDPEQGVASILSGAAEASDAASQRKALEIIEAFLSLAEVVDEVPRAVALHEKAAELCEALGDGELAASHLARAALMASLEVA